MARVKGAKTSELRSVISQTYNGAYPPPEEHICEGFLNEDYWQRASCSLLFFYFYDS
jgi:hypothetical protein